jgi:hypothetical protein
LISYLCLGVKSRALVLNVMAENLDALKCGGWGVFIAPTTKVAVGDGCCRRAHQTVQCASHITQPLELWQVGPPDSHCSLSGAPSSVCSDFCARSCTVHYRLLQTTVGAISRCSTGTPDSPVLHQTVRWIIVEWLPKFPKLSSLERISLVHRTLSSGAPDTVRWHTGQSGASDQGSLRLSFALFYLNPFLDFLLVCVEPLAPVELII